MMASRVWASWGGLVVILLSFAALIGGGCLTTAGSGFAVWCGLAGLGFAWMAVSCLCAGEPARTRGIAIYLACAAGGLILIAAYAVNATHHWRLGVALPVRHLTFLPGSADAAGTWESFAGMALVVAILGLSMLLEARQARWLVGIAALAGGLLAALTLSRRLGGVAVDANLLGRCFVSPNQYAALMNLMFPAVVTAGMRMHYVAVQRGRRSSPGLLVFLLAGLIGAATVVSGSRAGLLVMLLLVFGLARVHGRILGRHPFLAGGVGGGRWIVLGLPLAVLGAALAWSGWDRLAVAGLGQELDFRGRVAADTLAMWWAHPWWGTGPGTFDLVFPFYQGPDLEGYFFQHAHCEPVEFLSAYGLLGVGLLGLLLAGALRALAGTQRDGRGAPSFRALEGAGLLLGLAGMALHSLVDFPLRHPFNALLAAAWFGMVAVRMKTHAD